MSSDIFKEAISYGVGISETADHPQSPRKMQVTDVAYELAQKQLAGIQISSSEPIKAIVVYAKSDSEKPSEDVTEDFIEEFNKHRGNRENVELALKMLKKNRQLAGLDLGCSFIDVPSARHNLLLLAKLSHQELKMAALNSLIQVLEADQIEGESAFDLVVLAINLMKQMDRELMQTQLVEEQICICQAYGIVTELIQRHYAKKHLGGITKELKDQLIQTAKTLEDLNTHEDTQLHYTVEFALEGVKRLRDDKKELFEIFERVYHLIMGAVAFELGCAHIFQDEQLMPFQGLDVRIKHSWYDATLLFKEIAKKAHQDNNYLILLQYIVQEDAKTLDWKFSYNAIEQFEKIAIQGSTFEIREAALVGQKYGNKQIPGLIEFLNFHAYPQKRSYKPIIHFKAPVSKDKNIRIRMRCIEALIVIAQESRDVFMRREAKEWLIRRIKDEDDSDILETLATVVPKNKEEKDLWLNEQGAYAYNADNNEQTREKRLSDEIQEIANQHLHLYKITSTDKSPLNLSLVSLQLGNCLGLDPHHIQMYFHPGMGIQINDIHQLHINLEGMELIKEFVLRNITIKAIDFSHCQIDDTALGYLAESISTWNIYLLRLPALSGSLAKAFATILDLKLNLRIAFGSPHQEVFFGNALMRNKNAAAALEYFLMAYQKIEHKEDQKKFAATVLYQIGRASLSLEQLQNGEQSLLKALKLQPKSYRTHVLLARFYKEQNRLDEANHHAEQARKLRPSKSANIVKQ